MNSGLLCLVVFAALVGGGVLVGRAIADEGQDILSGPAAIPRSAGPEGEWLAGVVRDRRPKRLVGLAAMVRVEEPIVASAAVGLRMAGHDALLEVGDRWHIGSITKSVTATTIARLIEMGKMEWSETVGQRFPEENLHDDWKGVTLEQLLTHTAGAQDNFSMSMRLKQPARGPQRVRERRSAVLEVLTKKPRSVPGTKFAYSNVGYTIAGAMAEQATGLSWEDLVEREVFQPLELEGSGFGPPKSPLKTLPQPRGHRVLGSVRIGATDDMDNTPIMGPAGTVHMTLTDLTRYGLEHLRGQRGIDASRRYLRPETFQRLHAPKLNGYACGWVLREADDQIPHAVHWHNGSNTMWYALLAIVPEQNLVVAVTSNDGDIGRGEAAAWKVVEACVKRFSARAQ